MIIGQVNRHVGFSSGKVSLLTAARELTSARNAMYRAIDSGNKKIIADATERLNKATQVLKEVAGNKKLSILKQKLDTSA